MRQMVLELGDASTVNNDTNKLSCDLEFKVKVRRAMRRSRRDGLIGWRRASSLVPVCYSWCRLREKEELMPLTQTTPLQAASTDPRASWATFRANGAT